MPKKDKPDQEGVDFFKRVLNSHNQVTGYAQNSYQIFVVQRIRGSEIFIYLTDLYTIGLADYLNIRNSHPEVNCLVTASGYNSYTTEAKEQALSDSAGLFTVKEFMGALHHAKFWTYVPPEEDSNLKFRRKRGA